MCHYCGVLTSIDARQRQDNPRKATRDHKVPKADGGSDDDENLLLACQSCNNAKGDMPYLLFVALIKELQRDGLVHHLQRHCRAWADSSWDRARERGKTYQPFSDAYEWQDFYAKREGDGWEIQYVHGRPFYRRLKTA